MLVFYEHHIFKKINMYYLYLIDIISFHEIIENN
jgi:hypothetical protein